MNIYLFNPPRKNGDTHFVIQDDGQLYATGSMFECEMALMELKGAPMVFSHYRTRRWDPEDAWKPPYGLHNALWRGFHALNNLDISTWDTDTCAIDVMYCLDRCTKQDIIYKPKE